MTIPRLYACCFGLALALSCVSCDTYQYFTKQLPSFANLRGAAIAIASVVDEQGAITEEEVQAIIENCFPPDGLDDWGGKVLFLSRDEPSFSFLLIAPGRDGRIDVGNAAVYFEWDERFPRETVGDFDHDIVYHDRIPLTHASAK